MTETATPKVILVTLLFNSEDSFPPFLDYLQAQDFSDWELIVVDNNPKQDLASAELVRSDARVRIIVNGANHGFARAANQGLKAGLERGGELLILVNNDISFQPMFLREFVAARDRLNAGVIAPRIMEMSKPGEAWYAGGHFDYSRFFNNTHETAFDPAAPPEQRVVEFATGCCLGITPKVLETVGLLDENFFVYWEDVDFSLRLKEAGIPIYYVSEPALLHAGATSSGGVWGPSHLGLYYRSYMQLLRKHFTFGHAAWIAVLLLLRELKRRSMSARQAAALLKALATGLAIRLEPSPSMRVR